MVRYVPSSVQKEIDRIHRNYMNGELLVSLTELDDVLKNKEITIEERIKVDILRSEINCVSATYMVERGSLEIGMKFAQKAMKESKNHKDKTLRFDSLLNLAINYFYSNEWQESKKQVKEILTDFEDFEPSRDFYYLKRKALVLMLKGLLPFFKTYTGKGTSDVEIEKGFQLWIEGEKFCEENNLYLYQMGFLLNIKYMQTNLGDLDLALETGQKMVTISKEHLGKFSLAFSLYHLAWTYYNKNDFVKFYELNKERLIIVEESENKGMIASTYQNLGDYYLVIGEYDEALDYFKRSLEIYQKLNRENAIAFAQGDCGYVYFLKGDLGRALEFYEEAYPVLRENQPQDWFKVLTAFARVYTQKGDLDRALGFLDELMTIQEGFRNQIGISTVLMDQAMIYWQKGMKEQAISILQESFEIRYKVGNKALAASSLASLIQFNVEINNLEEAKKYFGHLDLINKELKNVHVSQYHKFSEALVHKKSSNLRDRLKAELLFEQLVEEDIQYSVLVQVLLHLCDILLLEMKETNEPEVLKKINKHVNKLQELSEKNNSHLLLVETLRLKAQLALIEFDVDNARALLLKAQNIAQENGFERLVLDLLEQQKKLTKQSIELKNLEKTSSTISQRMTLVELDDSVSVIKRTSITETVTKEEEVSKKLFSIQI